ncbi:MAG: 4Fe-4S binding protein, partial [Cyanobacteriota bacterium]
MNSNFKLNFLKNKFINKLIRMPFFPYILQFLALLFFLILIINGFMTGSPESYGNEITTFLRKTNFTTLIVWGLWWPGLILTTILLGRIWCTVCPMELVSNIFNRICRFLGFKGLKLNSFLSLGFIALLLYVILQLLVAGFEVHRVPIYTSYVLIGLLTIAVLAGVLFKEQRAFCKAFCPASLLLKAYSLFTPLILRKNINETCSNCDSKECVSEKNRNKLDVRSCPSYL